MFGVRRCDECGALLTQSDLRCPGCARPLHPAVGPPLRCEECGAIKFQNRLCERCYPGVPLVRENEKLPRTLRMPGRPTIIGSLFCAVFLFVGYEWGSADRGADDEEQLEQVRHSLLSSLDKEREQFDLERKALQEVQHPNAHDGPLGLRWGEPPPYVRSVLSRQFAYRSDATVASYYVQRYGGSYAKLPTDEVRAQFCQAGLAGLDVALSAGESPYSRWREALEATREQYGEPRTIQRTPPADAYEALLTRLVGEKGLKGALTDPAVMKQLGEVDHSLQDGAPVRAEWTLPDMVTLVLQIGQVSGQSSVSISFDKPDLSSACHPEAAVQR